MTYLDLDPAKFEKAFLESARRGTTASLFHAVIFIGLMISYRLGEVGFLAYFILLVFCLSSFARGCLLYSAKKRRARGEAIPAKLFQNLFRLTAFILGAAWAAAFTFSFCKLGFSLPTMGIYVVLMGFVPASLSLCPMDTMISGSFILTTSLPVIIVCFFSQTTDVPTTSLGLLYVAHFLYNMGLVRRNKIAYFDSVQNQLEVESQKRQLEGILDAVPGYVSWIDQDGIARGSNKMFANALLPPGADVKGMHFTEVIGGHNQINSLVSGFQAGAAEQAVHEVNAKLSGEKRWYILALRKFITSTGFNTVVVAVDISNEKMAQEELVSEKLRVTQSERLSLIGAMAGGVAHEINNPLAIIRGRLERLHELAESGEITPELAAQLAAKTIQTVDRIARIVRGLRLMARGESSDAPMTYNLVDLCRDVMELSASRARQAEANVEFVCDEKSLELLCQPTQVSQILLNLIQNSLDAIEDESEKWVKVQLTRTAEHVTVSVIDSGSRSAIKNPEKIFEPFFTTKPAGEGCGLGLSISQTLARRFGGDLRLDMERERTCFDLVLPIAPALMDAAPRTDEALTRGETTAPHGNDEKPLKRRRAAS